MMEIWCIKEITLEQKINYPHLRDFLKQYHLSNLRKETAHVGSHMGMLENCIDH